MTPEDKIVAAIDRLTEAIKSYSIDVFFANVARIMLAGAAVAIAGMIGCPPSKATPLLPPLSQPPLYDIGDPPKPPPNPNLQHWYTMDVPGVNGVLPVEVFAPRLYSPVATARPVDIDVAVPEPGTWILVVVIALTSLAFQIVPDVAVIVRSVVTTIVRVVCAVVLQVAARVYKIRRRRKALEE